MTASQRANFLPEQPTDRAVERSRKIALKKDVILWLQENDVGWSRDTANSMGSDFVNELADCLWYIDGHSASLDSRACTLPQEFRHFEGYNKPEKSKHRKRDLENLSVTTLDQHCNLLNSFIIIIIIINAS